MDVTWTSNPASGEEDDNHRWPESVFAVSGESNIAVEGRTKKHQRIPFGFWDSSYLKMTTNCVARHGCTKAGKTFIYFSLDLIF